MHTYATNLANRSWIIYAEAVAAVALFLLVGGIFEQLGVRVPYWISAPSSGALFSGIFALYDRILWRKTFFGVRLSAIPDLNGTYVGYVDIKQGKRPEERDQTVPCYVRISQTWSRMCVEFQTEFTLSRSSMAVVASNEAHPLLNGLRYEYHVESKPGSILEGMASHAGLARLLPQDNRWSVLEGEFFNDSRFHRYGDYRVERLSEGVGVDTWLKSVSTQSAS